MHKYSELLLKRLDGLVTELDHFGVISFRGVDTLAFLQNQLTNDLLEQPAGQARLNGYCSPKGRLIASFILWTDGSDVVALVSRDIAATIAARLSKFVLRAKVQVKDETALWSVTGMVGTSAMFARTGESAVDVDMALALAPMQLLTNDRGVILRITDALGLPRWISLARHAAIESGDRPAADSEQSSLWRWLEIQAGVPWITAPIQDQFVPQMINFEALGGVDFKKGCYPGQEVVARSQYLGKLKRRTLAAHVDSEMGALPGTEVFQRSGSSEARGMVVAAETSPEGGLDLLVELPLAASDAIDLSLGALDGPHLALGQLPYALPDNEIFVRPKL